MEWIGMDAAELHIITITNKPNAKKSKKKRGAEAPLKITS